MGLFTDIYNTVAKFFRQQDEQLEGDASKSVATNRLKLVLMQDRTNLTPKVLEQMRGELVDLLSKYLEMDKDMLELNFEQEGDQVALMLSIPVIRAKDEDEIEGLAESEEDIEDEETDEELNDKETYDGEENIEETDSEEQKTRKKRSKKVSPPEENMDETSFEETHNEEVMETEEV